MMLPPFHFGPPFYRNPFVPYNQNFQNNIKTTASNNFPTNNKVSQSSYFPSKEKDFSSNENLDMDTKKNDTNSYNNEDNYFELFGLKLHSDDLLLIGLLFFLYQEEVKDTYLYMALIMLLLS